jgi:hypothetical protein
VFGLIAAIALYLIIQAFSGFSHPLHGAVTVVVLALVYALFVPAMGVRHRHAASSRPLNQALQATPGCAFLISLRHWPGAPELRCWAARA